MHAERMGICTNVDQGPQCRTVGIGVTVSGNWNRGFGGDGIWHEVKGVWGWCFGGWERLTDGWDFLSRQVGSWYVYFYLRILVIETASFDREKWPTSKCPE